MSAFAERVYALVRQIPAGRVTSYGAIARILGSPHLARQVGWAMHTCPDDVPAHRVVNGRGEVSGSDLASGAALRRHLLELEGVEFDAEGRIDLDRYGWVFRSDPSRD